MPSDSIARSGSGSGIILLDKPRELSSNAALQRVKRALGAAKAGHAGTLDPLATGMLPILLGEATKIAGHLLHQDKAYQVQCRLGQSTDTYDAQGELTAERPVPALSAAQLTDALAHFTGRIQQRAPVYSAIKQGGQPLYRRVRRGEAIEAPVREVVIHAIRIEALDGPDLCLEVQCGSGTYIRSLAHDLGELLGCGGHVRELRRLWVTPFKSHAMVDLDQVQAGQVAPLPALAALGDWPQLALGEADVAWLGQGRSLERAGIPAGKVAGVAPDGRLAALLEADAEGHLRILRLLHPD